MVQRLLLIPILLTLPLSAQRKVDPRNSYTRVIAVVPLTGSGLPTDPKRPKYAPWPAGQAQDGIFAFYFEPTDDGKSALVEFSATNRAAFQALFDDKSVKVFEKGRVPKGQIESVLKSLRKDFSMDTFGLAMPSGAPAGPAPAGYAYYLTDHFAGIDLSKWAVAGAVAPSSAGLTAPDANGGTVISRVPIPDGSSEGEVRATVALATSGGNYTLFLQSSADARSGGTGAGTYLALEMQNPTFTGALCSANFVVFQSVAGVTSALTSFPHSCRNGMVLRLAAHKGTLLVWPDQADPMEFPLNVPTSGAGQPGVGAHGTPGGNAISEVQIGLADRIAPPAVDVKSIGVSVFRKRVDIRWKPVSDDAAGSGIAGYWLYRDRSYLGRTTGTVFSDEAVTSGAQHSYTVYAVDQHYNFSPESTVTASTPLPLKGKAPPPPATPVKK